MNIYCPFCDDVRKAKAFGVASGIFQTRTVVDAGPRPLARCGTCLAFERERMLHSCLIDRIGTNDCTLLHFAPSRATSKWLQTFENVTAVNTDLFPDKYRRVGEVVRSDITQLQFDDASFDFVVCSHVMEHIPDDVKAMREVHRVLKPGGSAFFMVPLLIDGEGPLEDPSIKSPRKRLAAFGQKDHVRIYDAPTFLTRLQTIGFAAEIYDPFADDPVKAVAYGVGQGNAVLIGKA